MFRLLQAFYSTPWALEPSMYALMEGVLLRWASGVRLNAQEIESAIGASALAPQAAAARREATAAAGAGMVGVIPIYGILTHRAYAAKDVSNPLTSTEAVSSVFRSYVSNPDIGSIVLDMDTPGGSVFGVQELAETIRGARGTKPIIAVANSQANSGGYWIASQADEVVVTPSGAVGSIGVLMSHSDRSAMYEKMGVKTEVIHSGKFKGEGGDHAPLTDETRMYLQGLSDTYYSAFTSAVAKGRGLPIDTVRGEAFGQGRVRLARDAVQAGMADRIDTLENVINSLACTSKRSGGGMAAATAALQIAVIEASVPNIN